MVCILTDDTKGLCQLGLKYGAPLVTVPGLLAKAKELQLNVIGCGCYNLSMYSDAISQARSVFDIPKNAGFTFTLLNIGGGFEDALFEDAIQQHFPDHRKIKVIAEPGFYASKVFSLAANIIARRAPFPNL